MMQAKIDGISQDLSFSDGTYANYLRLVLPDGSTIRAAIDTDTAGKISELFVRMGGLAAERAVGTAVSSRAEVSVAVPRDNTVTGDRAPVAVEDDDGNVQFGGDFDGPPDAGAAEEWVASVPATVTMPALRVTADSRGNPVVQGANVVDTSALTGGANADLEEDGIGSV